MLGEEVVEEVVVVVVLEDVDASVVVVPSASPTPSPHPAASSATTITALQTRRPERGDMSAFLARGWVRVPFSTCTT